MTKVAVAMSGGVDSSVAAALAVEKYGCENVFGLTMKLFCYSENSANDKSCCSLDAIADAAAVCKQLGIAHYVVDFEKEFADEVVADFVREYEQGRTPNPCVRCNSLIKFKHLLEKAMNLGADILVTGHYARITFSLSSSPASQLKSNQLTGDLDSRLRGNDVVIHLLKGLDKTKDQSYFLYNLNQEQLAHIWFPLGELKKTDTRKLAEKYNLKTAKKTESQDVCFVTTTTQDFLKDRVKTAPGNIVDASGKILGKHRGLPFYTIGQRRGLGGGFVEPMYVIGLDKGKNEVVVGPEKELYGDEMTVEGVSWTDKVPEFPCELQVMIRYNSEASPAILSSLSEAKDPEILHGVYPELAEWVQNDVRVKFDSPQRAITPGQTAVFYDGDEVIGGGVIVN